MNKVGEPTCMDWAMEQGRSFDDGESDSPLNPLVSKHSTPAATAQGGQSPGSFRRNGVVLDLNVRSLFSISAARSPQNRSRTPDRYQRGNSPTPNRMSNNTAGRGHGLLIPPSLSDLSLRSASSRTFWQSRSSTPSRKRSLELNLFDGSPQSKRRFVTEMNNSTGASLRYSAPCVQPSLLDGAARRRGVGL
ncbi:hypothetical protein N657DRAFT_132186 [Parathielavia appendiculata]|uniref:Uncharacterized protein n=1 Tax=Parathielavia appendiculata TaxID=2587402 RepID=A0AAN6TVJ9_9PEZI|nr:hypothetical protein N657DRAFT_132186 [Parathielavia appendiculata]